MNLSFFPFSSSNYLGEDAMRLQISSQRKFNPGIDYPDGRRAERLNNPEINNCRNPLPPVGLRHEGRLSCCQSPGVG